MTTRERNLAMILSGVIFLGIAGTASYVLIIDPILEKQTIAAGLQKDIDELKDKTGAIRKNAVKRLAEARRRSLPAEENLARREYSEMMYRLLRRADIPIGANVIPQPSPDIKGIPLIGPKKPAYTRLVTKIEFHKADMWSVQEFLQGYYRLNLLHQITSFSIQKSKEGSGVKSRQGDSEGRDLSVSLTSEAIIVDGAEDRNTLLSVPRAFPATLGGAGMLSLGLNAEAGRAVSPIQFTPVLSTRNRNYTLLAVKDMFHGPMVAPSLKIDTIADVTCAPAEEVPPIKIPVSGDVAYVGAINYSITSDSRLVPASGLKFNEKTRTLLVTPASGEVGTAKITVVAKAEGGQEAKSSFRFSIKEPEVAEGSKKDDISPAVLLVKIVIGSDGKAAALVNDTATNSKYEVDLTSSGVKVSKYYFLRGIRRREKLYEPTELAISDENVSTNRRFKVIAVTHDALIVQDLNPAEVKKAPEKAPAVPPAKGGKGGQKEPPKAKATDPLRGVAGLAGGAVREATANPPPVPTLLRWSAGKSLAALKELPQDEARKIFGLVAKSGPIVPTGLTGGQPVPSVGNTTAGLTEAPAPRGASE